MYWLILFFVFIFLLTISQKITSGTIVHHKTEVKEDWDKRLDYDTLESICQSCHNKEHKKAYNRKRL